VLTRDPAAAKPQVNFPGAIEGSFYTETLDFLRSYPTIPTYRVLDSDGNVILPEQEPNVS
jgi:2-oxoisovalerate dehydrogenase E1 component alpha subunit